MADTRQAIQEQFAQIRVYFVPEDLHRVLGAINKVKNTVVREANALPFRCANEFRFLIINNILSQKHMTGYASYSDRYAEWKEKAVGSLDFWKLFGDLIKNVGVHKLSAKGHSYRWMGGITPGAMSSGANSMYGGQGKSMLISVYGRWIELGRKGQPARPLFEPTTREYELEKWPTQVNRTSIFIRGSWA